MDRALIQAAAAGAGLELSDDMIRTLDCFIEELKEANQKLNLTAITEDEDIAVRHLEDSWHAAPPIPPEASLIDIGTGAGFPGLVLAMVRPDLDVTLVDATRKKVDFLKGVIDRLGLEKVRAIWGRAEELAHDPSLRDRFDVATARALTALPQLVELSLPFVRPGGFLIAMKGQDDEKDSAIGAIKRLNGRLDRVVHYELSGLDHPRSLVLIRKKDKTPSGFPRRMASILKSPL